MKGFDYPKLADEIRKKMFAEMADRQKRLSVAFFAFQIGVAKSTLQNMISEKQKSTDIFIIIRVCEWLGRTPNDFLI